VVIIRDLFWKFRLSASDAATQKETDVREPTKEAKRGCVCVWVIHPSVEMLKECVLIDAATSSAT
jgi:hypothetical protein